MRMVNDRFPERSRYGFEMVDAHRADNAGESRINRKFTPNQIIGIFGKFSAI